MPIAIWITKKHKAISNKTNLRIYSIVKNQTIQQFNSSARCHVNMLQIKKKMKRSSTQRYTAHTYTYD